MSEILEELSIQIDKFGKNQIEPFMEEDDHNGTFRMEIFNQIGELGITGLSMPEDLGGSDLGLEVFCGALCELAKFSVPYAVTVSVSSMVQSILNQFGTKEQIKKFLPPLVSGKEIGAFALSESSSGSDAASLKTTAKPSKDGYILNGSKLWITSAGIASTYIVMARTGKEGSKGVSAFIVKDGLKGFSYGKKENKMGWRTSPTRELIFDNCVVPKENLIGKEGEGFKVALNALDKGRVTIGAISVGCAMRAFDEAVKYSLSRKQFGQNIFDFQGLQWMLADMLVEIKSSELLVKQAAKSFDQGKPDNLLGSIAKLKASDTAMKVTTDAVQILGGVGYTKEYPVERFMRDAKVLQIVEGTNQIQKVVISRHIKKEFS